MHLSERSEKVDRFQELLVARATGSAYDAHEEYATLRGELMADTEIGSLVPKFVRTCRTLDQFWSFIQGKFARYKERREYLWSEFQNIHDHLDERQRSPLSLSVEPRLGALDSESVNELWVKAMQRKQTDPQGAITSARSLLESVCKGILDELSVEYNNGDDLQSLYKAIARELSLSPSQHHEQVFKKILSGCVSVVDGLGALRNSLSDAHGQGLKTVRPADRHAELAVNLAGSMATFLVATWQTKRPALQK